MEYSLRRPLSLVASGFMLLQCTPDFDSLTAGHPGVGDSGTSGSANVGGMQTGGTQTGGTQTGGTQTGGTQTGGMQTGSTQTGGDVNVGPGGDGGVVGHEPGGAGGQFQGGEGGEGGGGAGEPCSFAPLGATFYDTFDTGLDGPGFTDVIARASTTTTKGATCSSAWDPTVGSSCLGAFHMRASYQGYASGGDKDEVAYGDLYFDSVDWSSAVALHVMVKVAPLNAPIQGVQLYVMSGDDYRYIRELRS